MKQKMQVCLPFLSHRMPNRCRSNCFTFLTNGYAFIRLVGVIGIIYLITVKHYSHKHCDETKLTSRAQWRSEARTKESHKQDLEGPHRRH